MDTSIRPLDEASALPAVAYTAPHWFDFEQREVFARHWQYVCHESELPGIGDHIARDIAGAPVVVVRDEACDLQAYYNVCRHRAGPLVTCDGKGLKRFRCQYHGWTYGLDGKLRQAPEMQDAKGFERENVALKSLHLITWQGLVFVALSGTAPRSEAYFGGITERIAPIDLTSMRHARQDVYEMNCNWKVYVDNFLEGYHIPLVHPELDKVVDYRSYTTELSDWHSLQTAPVSGNEDAYGQGEACYYFLYPNTMLNILPGRVQTNRVEAIDANHCRVVFDYYYDKSDAAAQARADADATFSDEVQEEDRLICERVQKGLGSGAYEAGRLCPAQESGVWHFQNLLRQAYLAAHP